MWGCHLRADDVAITRAGFIFLWFWLFEKICNGEVKMNECKDHIYDIEGFCEWEKDGVIKTQTFFECPVCKNGVASEIIVRKLA